MVFRGEQFLKIKSIALQSLRQFRAADFRNRASVHYHPGLLLFTFMSMWGNYWGLDLFLAVTIHHCPCAS